VPFQSLTARRADQRGTGLLDVLLGMTIFALLIVIGGQNYSTYKERATMSALTANMNQIVVAMDQYLTDNGEVPPPGNSGISYPTAVAYYINAGSGSSLTNLGTLSAKLGPGVSIGRYGRYGATQGFDANQTYYLCLIHKGSDGKIDAWAGWYSPQDRFYDSGTGTKANTGTTACGPVVDIP
jgi:type II secretory pathway pseudopilin PulG